MTTTTLKKENVIAAALHVQRFSPLYHGTKHGGIQAGIVLERKQRVLYPNGQAAGIERHSLYVLIKPMRPQSLPPEHTSYNKAMPTPRRSQLLIMSLSMNL